MKHLSISEIEDKLMECLIKAEKAGNAWAEAKSVYEDLDDKKKPYLSSLMPLVGSQAQKEQEALIKPEWNTYLNGLAGARLNFYRAQVAYDMLKCKIDVLRSFMSARKEEVKNFRG